ncbi:C25 family cysteine peptidase [Mitsuaria sp. GD03876]|uniref:C25 family cysteine peptidase n=1 Tax=Mitsuaria sp. GD03876 TaxID=2975399 RepID=UPI00244C79E8|nr:C25 family cysteine peptidase [Mitsuaria sp. GD03876]MDH0864947.1 C25 family cysteine peptidase [Mitsuaria sp. GD03876]
MDKFVILHRGALRAKYGAAALKKIEAALKRLVRQDKRRGIDTTLAAVDVASEMKPYGARPMPAKPDARSLKAVIDALAKARQPHYFLLLGGPDVLPMVPLKSPTPSDGDPHVPSDLPYACESGYSTDPNRFLGPTRVVGRLPDLPGATRPDLLLQLLRAATEHESRQRQDFATSFFGLSAEVWQASTRQSLDNTFGPSNPLHLSPPDGPSWTKAELAPRMHFINCHGADHDPSYYGQHGEQFPEALSSAAVKGRVSTGSVIAAECCYGAQVFDPALVDSGEWPISVRYLADGAAAFVGSTTIAYGPSVGNGSADLLCQYFLQRVLAGASTGRALLEARQQFAGARTHLDPVDLKTLAQFYLLGDPSLQPVTFVGHALTKTKAFKQAFATVQDRGVRGLRRERLEREGRNLARSLPRLKAVDARPAAAVTRAVTPMLRESGLSPADCQLTSYQVVGAPDLRVVHVYTATLPAADATMRPLSLVATEQGGRLLHVRRMHAR